MGSAIFIHVRRGENMPTLGCVALSEEEIRKVLAWLDPAAKPMAVIGTQAAITGLVPKPNQRRENSANRLPKGFVYADELIPDLRLDLRYAGSHNFVGGKVDGYLKTRCVLSREAAEALKKVQEELRQFGLGVKIFDAYRPQTAVRHFVRWARDVKDVKAKPEFYPDVSKENLFKEGYIAEKSSHSRGSTVDLTIASLGESEQELDMGSGFDFFGVSSWPDYPRIPLPSRAHRMLLRSVMEKYGFKPYPQEWWHFTLKKEPWPDTYFDFPVQ
jgi:D-alanyl-D-alanine dipeptidase